MKKVGPWFAIAIAFYYKPTLSLSKSDILKGLRFRQELCDALVSQCIVNTSLKHSDEAIVSQRTKRVCLRNPPS